MSLCEVHSSEKDPFDGRDEANQKEGFKSRVVTEAYIFLSLHLRWWCGHGGLQKEISLLMKELELVKEQKYSVICTEGPAALTGITGVFQHHLPDGFATVPVAMCQNDHHPSGVGRWGGTLSSQ